MNDKTEVIVPELLTREQLVASHWPECYINEALELNAALRNLAFAMLKMKKQNQQ